MIEIHTPVVFPTIPGAANDYFRFQRSYQEVNDSPQIAEVTPPIQTLEPQLAALRSNLLELPGPIERQKQLLEQLNRIVEVILIEEAYKPLMEFCESESEAESQTS